MSNKTTTAVIFVAAIFLLAAYTVVQAAYGTGREEFDTLAVGQQGVGGVTYFNGTIINDTTNNDGGAIPVTVGDDVRIDGRIWRGATAGAGDGMPLIVNDDLQVIGNLRTESLTGPNQVKLPLAYGTCNSDGTKRGGTDNFTCSWDGANQRYIIDIDGLSYNTQNYFTIVTPLSVAGYPYVMNPNSMLAVHFLDAHGYGPQGNFSFVTFTIN
ncbi:hypothetical protein ACFL04_04335 [Patescibacteria group bacterium]